jgi:YbbR domain-containing protein
MRFLREWILHNWSLKLLSLLISLFLWVTYMTEPVAEVGYMLPIEFLNVPPGVELAGDVPTQVHVRVRGRSALLRRLAPADLGITVDLTGKQTGDQDVQITPQDVDAPYGARVVSIMPADLHVRLVPRHASPSP